MRLLALGGVLIAGLGGCGESSSDVPSSNDLVERYCSYGAVSQAQLEGCIEHVSVSDVEQGDPKAAFYARGEIDSCRGDAGPFCDQ